MQNIVCTKCTWENAWREKLGTGIAKYEHIRFMLKGQSSYIHNIRHEY